MKYILTTLQTNTEKEYPSIRQIALELEITYCCAYQNFLFNCGDQTRVAKKRTQVNFNQKFKITEKPINSGLLL